MSTDVEMGKIFPFAFEEILEALAGDVVLGDVDGAEGGPIKLDQLLYPLFPQILVS